ncbi:Uncharacterised protein [Mycobacteroides abscessus subsp. abscessus]|nr:Uncharacterised protein [Mycobacteroides abscessus subsp. abscessus]
MPYEELPNGTRLRYRVRISSLVSSLSSVSAMRISRILRAGVVSMAARRSASVLATTSSWKFFTYCWSSVEAPCWTSPLVVLVRKARTVPCQSTPSCSAKRRSSMEMIASFMSLEMRSLGTSKRRCS